MDSPGVEEAIRLGDVFAQLVEYHHQTKQLQQAYEYLEKMRKKKIIMTPYLDPHIIEEVYSAMGMQPPGKEQKQNDGIEEDIREEYWIWLILI